MVYERVLEYGVGAGAKGVHVVGNARDYGWKQSKKPGKSQMARKDLGIVGLECYGKCRAGCARMSTGKCWGCVSFEGDENRRWKAGWRGDRIGLLRSCRRV